jgi:hypothetical protein
MALSPADFYAYSRATGAPYPEDAEERAEMTPEVLEFRRNQLRAPDQGPNLLETLGLGALVAGGLAGVGFGAKRFLGGRQPKATSAAPGVTKADLTRVAEASAPAPEQYAAPSKVAAIPQATIDLQEKTKEAPTLLGFLQDVRQKEEFGSIGRPATPYRPGSLADRVAKEQQQRVQNQLDTVNPETETYVAKLNERRKARAAQAQNLADTVRNALISGNEQEGYDLSMPQVEMAGSSAASAFAKAEQRKQQRQPAPVTRTWQTKLFDDRGMLRQDVIAMHLGDENIIPKNIAEQLMSSAVIDRQSRINKSGREVQRGSGVILGFTDSAAIFQATKHVRENLLANDYQNSIKNYLLNGDPGDLQPAQSRGFGWSARTASPTDVITISTGEGGEKTLAASRRASAKYDLSDLEPLYLDPQTKTLVRKADIGTSGTPGAEAGTGIGEEIGQAVAFVPREEMAPFVSSPGVSGSGEERYKDQGVGYSIGGVKEFGGGSGAGYVEKDPSLPVLSPEEHVVNKNVGISSNGKIFAKVKPVSLTGDPRLSKRLDQDYGNFFYQHPVTGERWKSLEEASAFVNQVHSQFNETQLQQIQSQLESKELYRGPMQVALSGTDTSGRQRKTWLDPYQKLSDIGEATLSSQMQDMLLQKGVIQEAQTEEGAKYLRQTRYSVPEVIEGQETKTWTLGPEHTGLFPTTTYEGKRNHYEYLNAVQNSYQKLTGNRLADIDLALDLRSKKGGQYLGGPSSNPYLNKALTVANTLTQISEPTRQRVMEPGAIEGLGERYGLGATVSERASKTVPSRQRSVPLVSATFEPIYEWNAEKQAMEYLGEQAKYTTTTRKVSPETIGAKRLASALADYRSRSGRPMKRSDFMQFASSIAQQEGADINELVKQAAVISRGAGEQAVIGPVMKEGRRLLTTMDRYAPEQEVAETISEYDYGQKISPSRQARDLDRIHNVVNTETGQVTQMTLRRMLELNEGTEASTDVDMGLTARQAQRARLEPPGTTEQFTIDDQMLSNQINRLMAQSNRRAGKRRNR